MVHSIDCDYSVEGRGDPLFLVHGIGTTKDAWSFMLAKLTQNFTVITYDLRGHGNSLETKDEFGLDELVADLERVREMTGFEKAHFAGHSLGGMICPAYSRKFPDRVVSLGLLSTAAGRTEEDSLKVLNVIKAMEENGIEKTLNTLTNRWFTDEFLTKHSDLVKRRLDQVMKTDANIFLNVFRIYAKTEMAPWLSEVIAPSLVLTGEQDGGCNPRLNKFIADNLKNSKLVILPKYKHSLLIEAPDEVAKNLIQFMSKFKIK
jgi:pimeloyl-ACP methyl ester carboxylesterase